MRGNGLLAIRIHSIAGFNKMPSSKGPNPFDNVAFAVDGDQVRFKEYMTTGWQPAKDVGSMQLSEVSYDLESRTNHTLACLFQIYEWDGGDGYNNLGDWIETAANQAGR